MSNTGVYFLLSKNGRYYTGCTFRLPERLAEHHRGHVKATSNLLPVFLVGFVPCKNYSEARKLERKIKKAKSRSVIEDYIEKYPASEV